MSAKLNLASHPFRNRALPWIITAAVSCLSVLALVFILSKSNQMSKQANDVEAQLQNLRQQETALQKRREEIEQSLSPEQRRVLDAAHALVDRKRFSWSRLFADLEASMPSNVRVSRINVRSVNFRGGRTIADLELAVFSKDSNEVTRMIADMSRSGIFQAELRAQNQSKARGETGAEWIMDVRYMPRASSSASNAVAANEASN